MNVQVLLPVCPGCGGTAWSSIEELTGGSRSYALRADGWTLVDSSFELLETNYSCDDCGYDPSDENDDDGLLEMLADVDTAPAADMAAGRPSEDVSPSLWEPGSMPV